MTISKDGTKVRCHVCAQWFGSLNSHLRRHHMDAASYKELFGLKRAASLLPPSVQAKQRAAAAIKLAQGKIGPHTLPPGKPRQKGLKNRLQTKIEASTQRKGVNTRGGKRTRWRHR